MRKTGSTAAALVAATLVAGTAVTAVGASTASNAASGRDAFTRQVSDDADVARAALKAVAAHPQAVHSGDRQAFTVTGALVDHDGTSHVRLARTYAGLPVIGGDLVVHQSPQGAWEGRSQTLAKDLTLAVTPTVGKAAAGAAAVAPSKVTRSITGDEVEATRLVVDATGATPRLAYEVAHRRHPEGRHPEPARVLRRRPDRRGAAPGAADRDRRRLRPVVVRRHRAAAAHAERVDVPAEGPDPRQHLHHRPEQQGGPDRLPDLRQRVPDRDAVHQPGRLVRQRHDEQPRVGRRGRAVRHQRDLGLLQVRARPERHLRHRRRARSTASTTATATSTPSGTARR